MNMDQDQLVPVAPVTVLGIGNIILRDEGFGVRAVEYLEEHYRFSPDVRLLDGGTLGPELLHFRGRCPRMRSGFRMCSRG